MTKDTRRNLALAAAMTMLPAAIWSQQAVAAKNTTPATAAHDEENEAPAQAKKPGGEGIKVHGHWVLEVKDKDGRVTARREFNNSLVGSSSLGLVTGSQLVAAILSGNVAVGDPSIGLVQFGSGPAPTDPSLFCNIGTQPSGVSCFIFGTSNAVLYNGGKLPFATGLGAVVNFTGNPSLVFAGNYTVPSGLTQISAVQTLYSVCVPGVEQASFGGYVTPNGSGLAFSGSSNFRNEDFSSSGCTPSNIAATNDLGYGGVFTSTTVTSGGVAAPLPVATGQLVSISVTITFS